MEVHVNPAATAPSCTCQRVANAARERRPLEQTLSPHSEDLAIFILLLSVDMELRDSRGRERGLEH